MMKEIVFVDLFQAESVLNQDKSEQIKKKELKADHCCL